MGCINSTKKLSEIDNDSILRVKCVRITPEVRIGLLELSPKELVFLPQGRSREAVIWALQHLRRYGVSGDVFSFEAGRRCMSGPGIYKFRCENADELYRLFQRYVNAVASLTNDDIFGPRDRDHPSHTFGRPDPNPHSNNYLEPAPVGTGVTATMTLPSGQHQTLTTQRIIAIQESFSSSPLSLIDSPDSVPSLSFPNETANFVNQHPSTPGAASAQLSITTSNLYLEHPLRVNATTTASHTNSFFGGNTIYGVISGLVGNGVGGGGSAFSTLQRRTLTKRSSLDAPPEECAPMLTPIMAGVTLEAIHMYANVEPGQKKLTKSDKLHDSNARSSDNLTRANKPLLLLPPPNGKDRLVISPEGVNYCVLDLDQRSPVQSSPKTCFGSGLSLIIGERSESISLDLQSPPPTVKEEDEQSEETLQPYNQQQQQISESLLGYSTIDFIKTCALIKSTTQGTDFDGDPEQGESRITRHSKCVRKSFSISE